ncbi:MAG: UbiA family prenyltransferase [Nocardioidaceae bacterium]|nr:UbiA family prenyltransferase [Nocardioidaceae bacterium]
MRFRGDHGVIVSLALSSHPLPSAAMTIVLTAAAALSGRSGTECLLVAATIVSGQLTVGWVNDVVDRQRDRQVGRTDKPLATGRIDPRTVIFAVACAGLLVIALSMANGITAGVAHLLAVASAWLYNFWFKRTALSWLPYALSFGLLPAFLSYGGLVGAPDSVTGGPPTWAMTVLAALLGIGIHFLNALPDLDEDRATGVRHLPLRLAERVGAPGLLRFARAYTLVAGAALIAAALGVGLRQ